MTRSRWNPRRGLSAAALVGIAAVALGACASQDADRDDVINAVEEADGSRDVAECIAEGFFDEQAGFSQDEINDLANADTPDDFPEGIADQATQIMDTCYQSDGETFEAEGESAEGSESTESTETSDTTASTEAGDAAESTTTTAAAE
jgi:hypothetical protein